MEGKSIIVIRSYLSRLIKYACECLMAATVIIVFIQVVFRYVFHHPFVWAEELARFCFIWISMLGSVLGIESRGHFSLDMVVKKLNPKIQRFVELSARIVVCFFLITLTYYSIKLTKISGSQTSPAMGWTFGYIVVILPVGFFLMCFFLISSGIGTNFGKDV